MDTQFNVFEILQIAEEVERRARKFYLRAAECCPDQERRTVCYSLASRRRKRQCAWIRIRKEYTEKTGDFGTFDPDDYLLSNPRVLAGLTWFGSSLNSPRTSTGQESKEQIILDAIKRSRGVAIFYNGLKEFACNPDSRMMVDYMISEACRDIRVLSGSLERMRSSRGSGGLSVEAMAVSHGAS
jgi:rubrerythrin